MGPLPSGQQYLRLMDSGHRSREVKGKVVPLHAEMALGVRGGIAPNLP
jgi:hypothetical protein